ncbi:bifunctional oligoribonuclease/PAP phosphatase NrnA [Acidobacteria bacterium AH-259-D05]|nr:bifunctional oligoribonuclease/PAP phosphatase NrnA [Acidobacteria bacterium AH-259-D05]
MMLKSLSSTEHPPSKPMEEIVRFIREHERFVVTSHARPDGDSIGSALALALVLEKVGKSADVIGADPHPRSFLFLPEIDKIHITDRVQGQYEGLFILECNDLKRPALQGLDQYFVINIDHHPNTEPFGDLNWVDSSAAAVGEMVYHLLQVLEVQLTPEIATNLYVAIFTDTGSFQYSNTSAKIFSIVADLVHHGVSPSAVAQSIHMSQPHERIKLLGMLLNTLKIHPSKKIASITLTREILKETGAAADDTEGMVNYPLSIKGVELAAFFRQEGEHSFRVSLRSKSRHDVSAVAQHFGGGGHRNAAGLSVEGSLEEALGKVTGELEKLLEKTVTSPESSQPNNPTIECDDEP